MKKKIVAFLIFAIMILILIRCGSLEVKKIEENEFTELTEMETELYDMIEPYYIPEIYPDFDSYEDSNFYMDKKVKYEDFSDEARLYYAYKTIDNVERKWFSSCDELKGYTYKGEDIAETCKRSEGAIIAKDESSEEWFFNNVDKEKIENAYYKMYGKEKSFPLKDFTMSYTGTCLYSKENDNYLCFNLMGGDTTTRYVETKFDYVKRNKDSIEIFDRYLLIEERADGGKNYYKSHIHKDKRINSEEKDFTKGALYKHTFKKDKDDNYYWYSSERVE